MLDVFNSPLEKQKDNAMGLIEKYILEYSAGLNVVFSQHLSMYF